TLLVVNAALAIELQALAQDVRLERIEGRLEVFRIRPEPVEIRLPRGEIELEIHLRSRRHLAEADMYEALIVVEHGQARREFIELLGKEFAVDGIFAEALALPGAEFRLDDLQQTGNIGPLDAREQGAPLPIAELHLFAYDC